MTRRNSFVVAIMLIASLSLIACGSSPVPTGPSSNTPVVVSPTPTPTPTPVTPSAFSVGIGAVPSGALAITAVSFDGNNAVVGAVVTFASFDLVRDETVLHEFTHAAGAFHTNKVGFVMYPGFQPTVTGYAPEESQNLGMMFRMKTGVACPSDSSVVFMELVCGDNSENISNPGIRPVGHLTGSITARVDPSLSTKLSNLQAQADNWAGNLSGFSMTLVLGSSSSNYSAMRVSSVPGVRTFIIVD